VLIKIKILIKSQITIRSMKILVVGSTGVLGRHVIPRLIERGHKVRALVLHTEQARFLLQGGAEPVVGDIFDRNSLEVAANGCDVALHLATAIPKSADQDWSLNDRIRRDGTQNFISAATKNGIQRYIQQSIIFVYGENGQNIIDESAALNPINIVQSAVDMENIVRSSTLNWCILRAGLLYGPGTGLEDNWRQDAKQRTLMLPGDGNDLISLIHVVDMVRAIIAAAEDRSDVTVYNIVDDEPVSYKILFNYISEQLNVENPETGGPKFLPSLGCSNVKAKQELSWQPVFPSYRSGLA
jgi:nucleoside-diphosphate-sugar epimerase